MIRLTLFENARGIPVGYRVRGHAGFADKGLDIVCAAASSLSVACANALESICGITPGVTTADGLLEIRFPDGDSRDVQVILGVLRQGFSDLREQYPDCIAPEKITIREE